MSKTSIEWTERTWNPVRGCTKISPGCKHCYAETFAERWRGVSGHPYEQGFDLRLVPEKLSEPLSRRKPTTYFVNSMSDLFHEDVPFEYVAAVFGVMAACPWHTFQVLTKRPERMRGFFAWLEVYQGNIDATWQLGPWESRYMALQRSAAMRGVQFSRGDEWPWPLLNVWLGVSVEDRKYGLPRIAELRDTPAAVRFLSVEPLLEDLGTLDLTGIDWVIVGGESGHGARPMKPGWAQSIRDQCVAAGVAFFFKQWGEWCHPDQLPDATVRDLDAVDPAHMHGDELLRVGKKAAGRELDGRTWDEPPRRRA